MEIPKKPVAEPSGAGRDGGRFRGSMGDSLSSSGAGQGLRAFHNAMVAKGIFLKLKLGTLQDYNALIFL
jgi:hypothetical protein